MKRLTAAILFAFLVVVLALGCSSSTDPDGDVDGDIEGDFFPDGDEDGDVDGDSDGDVPDGDPPDGDQIDVDGDPDGDDETDGDADEIEQPEPTIAFDDGPSWGVTYDDDSSDDAGMQIDIALLTTEVPEGLPVTLNVNGADLDPVNVAADGSVLFEDVTILPGLNTLAVEVDIADVENPTDMAELTLSGCRLSFNAPLAATTLSDAGGDCATTCGDDKDCNSPNLQFDVMVNTENVAGGLTAALTVGDSDTPQNAIVGTDEVTFDDVSMPHDAGLTLYVEAPDGDEGVCSAEITITVDMGCECHLELAPVPEYYNLDSVDDDAVAEGFQKTYVATSDNCLTGSSVNFTLDGERASTVVILGSGDNGAQEAAVTLTSSREEGGSHE